MNRNFSHFCEILGALFKVAPVLRTLGKETASKITLLSRKKFFRYADWGTVLKCLKDAAKYIF